MDADTCLLFEGILIPAPSYLSHMLSAFMMLKKKISELDKCFGVFVYFIGRSHFYWQRDCSISSFTSLFPGKVGVKIVIFKNYEGND